MRSLLRYPASIVAAVRFASPMPPYAHYAISEPLFHARERASEGPSDRAGGGQGPIFNANPSLYPLALSAPSTIVKPDAERFLGNTSR